MRYVFFIKKNEVKNKILFIDLCEDNTKFGMKSCNALEKITDNKFTYINLLHYTKEYKENPEIFIEKYKNANKLKITNINEYNEFFIGVHGKKEDREECHYLGFDEERKYESLFDAESLAFFFEIILIINNYNKNKKILLNLSMCYAGRIDNYENLYIEHLVSDLFKESFAHKLIHSFSKEYTFELSAYTGTVGIDELSGQIWVENEQQLKIVPKF